jgi:GrpB-like predicted nucleotidyltransferase (UPF0157 family)
MIFPMLGLKRGEVILVPHHKKWKNLFEKEKRMLEKQIGHLVVEIQHIGSTAIPPILAKPILDIGIGIHKLSNAKSVVKAMKKMGYTHVSKSRHHYEYLFVKGPESKRTHHIHLLRYKGKVWNKMISFRDYLQQHPSVAKQYERLKVRLAKKFQHQRPAYTKAKRSFVDHIAMLERKARKI